VYFCNGIKTSDEEHVDMKLIFRSFRQSLRNIEDNSHFYNLHLHRCLTFTAD